MKSADIKVGERYSAGWYGHVEVLETHVQRVIGYGGKSRRDGVKVVVIGDNSPAPSGTIVTISSSAIQQTWQDHQKRINAEQLARELNTERKQEGELLLPQLEAALAEKGIKLQRHWMGWGFKSKGESVAANISISVDDLEKLLKLVSDTKAQPELSSALGQLFATSP